MELDLGGTIMIQTETTNFLTDYEEYSRVRSAKGVALALKVSKLSNPGLSSRLSPDRKKTVLLRAG